MKKERPELFKKTLLACTLAIGALALSGCEADGDPSEAGGISGGSSGGVSSGGTSGGGGLANDGSVTTTITEGGVALSGNFICTAGAKAYGPTPSTTASANGLVGGAVSPLLQLLGGDTLTQLLNSVRDQPFAVDGNLDTAATYSLTLGLLGGLISSVDFVVGLNGTAPVGSYAVFGLSFPVATVELSLIQTVTVTTFLGTTEQETVSVDATSLDLLGAVGTADPFRFVGLRVTQPYNSVSVTLTPSVLSANVGDAMKIHDLCTGGRLVAAAP